MKGRKKRNYLLKDDSVLEDKFRTRNLQDTKFATRLLLNLLKALYPDGGDQRVLSRPGPLTDRLRRGWGIQGLKKGPDGKRVSDDRHHAIDALIVAATGQAELQKLIIKFQEAERIGSHREFSDLPAPWPSFREKAMEKRDDIFVSRAERRRTRGEAHAATVRSISERDGREIVYERKKVDEKLTRDDLRRIKDPERNRSILETLEAWIEAGNLKDRPPMKRIGGRNADGVEKESERFEPIRKITLRTNKKPDVRVRDGAADRGEMVRVDVFRKQSNNGRWEYFVVPVYPHQAANRKRWKEPPAQFVERDKPSSEWQSVNDDFEFLWSIYPNSLLQISRGEKDGGGRFGYFRGFDVNTNSISISPHESQAKERVIRSIGVRRLLAFKKFAVDRLGRRFEIPREKRTWHGEVCT